ncbi:MAG TPA: outer membrane protein transport protein [Gemmatimonadales bacterium]|nr:outer membrane protein transport protein [Gemmatimonadales bacterium]
MLASGLAATAAPAWAQGFQVNEHGTCVMGRGGAGVALACPDGSGIFYNPSGILARQGWTISAGVTVIDAFGGFTDDLTGTTTDLENNPVPVPHAFVTYGRDRWAAAVGMFVPYGLGTEWPNTFAGRFAGYDNNLSNIYIQPTFAYRIHPRVSVGAGLDIVWGKVTLTQRVDLAEQAVPNPSLPAGTTFGMLGIPSGTDFADGQLNGTGTGFGGHLGLTVQLHPRVSFGAKYLFRVPMDFEGDVDFEPASTGIILPEGNPFGVPAGTPLDSLVAGAFIAGPLLDQNVTASVTMPDQLTAGLAFQVTPALSILADYNWVNWSIFDTLPVDFETSPQLNSRTVENYEDTHGVRLGFDWAATARLAVRGGYIYHTAAAPAETVTPLLPEGKRNEFTVGLGYEFSRLFRADLAYQYLLQQNRRGRVREFPSGVEPDLSLNNGLYEFKAHLLAVTLTAGF